MEKGIFGFKAEYESEADRCFLIMTKQDLRAGDIIDFQVEMLCGNNIPGLADLDVRVNNSEIKLYYSIGGLLNLNNFFKRQRLGREDFIAFLISLTTTLVESKNYFLNEKSIILNENYIYIDPKTKQISCVYLPIEIEQDINQVFRASVMNLMIHLANIQPQEEVFQKILQLLRDEDFSLTNFGKRLKNLNGRVGIFERTFDQRDEKVGTFSFPSDPALDEVPLKRLELARTRNKTRTEIGSGKDQTLAPIQQKGKFRPVLLILLAIGSVAAAVVSNLPDIGAIQGVLGNLTHLESDGKGVIFILGLALLLGLVFREKLKNAFLNVGFQKAISPGLVQTPSFVSTGGKVLPDDVPKSAFEPTLGMGYGHYDAQDETTLLNINSDETVLLSPTYPTLKAVFSDETVIINKCNFIIGRNRDTCDYLIENKSIGRAHAQIDNDAGSFYLIDLDSQNGTFINGTKLVSNKKYELKDSQNISFANLEYCFKLG